jgi:hypothetical protein
VEFTSYGLTLDFLGRGGPGYLVSAKKSVFWITPFLGFIENFFARELLLIVLALFGLFVKNRHSRFAISALIMLMILRNVSRLYISYYILFFTPLLAFLAFQALSFLREKFVGDSRRNHLIFVSLVLTLSLVYLGYTFQALTSIVIDKTNSNVISLVNELSKELPEGTVVMERDISLMPYFLRNGREDMIFHFYPEDKLQALALVPDEGCVLWISPKDDLGITDDELFMIDFKDTLPLGGGRVALEDDTGSWRFFSKGSCVLP